MRTIVPLQLTCRVLKVSKSGFYYWNQPTFSKQKKENEDLKKEINKISEKSRQTYGYLRIHASLKMQGFGCGKNRIYRLMKQEGMSGLVKKCFKVCTTDSNHLSPIAERIFKTEDIKTHPKAANQVWVSDISFIKTQSGTLYLATYLDLFTRKIVGFSVKEHMQTNLLFDALEMAIGRQGTLPESCIWHSDQGSQYASEAYCERLKSLKVKASMSRKGNCYDNAFAETFFATIKKELVYRTKFETKEEAKKSIFEYIEVWYNRQRLHSSIGYLSPVQFESSLSM